MRVNRYFRIISYDGLKFYLQYKNVHKEHKYDWEFIKVVDPTKEYEHFYIPTYTDIKDAKEILHRYAYDTFDATDHDINCCKNVIVLESFETYQKEAI